MPIAPNQTGKCPHCSTSNRFENTTDSRGRTCSSQSVLHKSNNYASLEMCRCTNCGKIIILFQKRMIYPLGAIRSTASKEIPINIGQDFNEACLVESLSSKASAALARRCLQNMLHEQGITKDNLSKEIDEAMKILPSHLSEAIDAIRNIGNFAAHPMKFTHSGEIIDVEEGETEWILDVLEQLFDFYYVQPAITKAKKTALDAKLQSAGKPASK
jgi:hypothetical protein